MSKRDAAKPVEKRVIRCAIYTRKSTEEGLEQAFNSLDAQRESGEACVAAQRHEGWVCLPDRYDDGGFSGGNITTRRIRHDARPAAGTRLVREYRGVEHTVTVLADGYEWQGRPYRSLSAIARAITGTRWNGLIFFGVKRQGSAA